MAAPGSTRRANCESRHRVKYTEHLKQRLASYERQLKELAGLQRVRPEDDSIAADIMELESHAANVETHYRSQVRKK